MKEWKEKHKVTFTVVSDPNFAKTYGVMKQHTTSLPHQYVIDGKDMKLLLATGGVGSRFTKCTEDAECGSNGCDLEDICKNITCDEHSDCESGFCKQLTCQGLTCDQHDSCAAGSCEKEGVCTEDDCSAGSDCPSLQCKSGTCRGTTETERGWLDLLTD